MALFPDMPLGPASSLAGRGNGKNRGIPAGEPVGVLPGLNSSLIRLLRNFSPGDLGVCIVDEKLVLSLPIPNWGENSWLEQGDTSYTAGQDTDLTIYTVPTDSRAVLYSVGIDIATGDNELEEVYITQPPGYGAGTRKALLIKKAGAANIWWPDPGAIQVPTWIVHPGPILLEPGAIIEAGIDGTGVSAGTIAAQIFLRVTKLISAQLP